MIRRHILIILRGVEYEMIGYRPSMLRGLDIFPTPCYNDTRGHGGVVLRHAPQFFVMAKDRFLLGESRSIVQPTLSLLGSYVVRWVKPTSTSILVEEG